MPVITAKDKDTGKTVKFNWKGEGQPTPDDLHSIFTDAMEWGKKQVLDYKGKMEGIARLDPWQRQQYVLQRIDKGDAMALMQPLQMGGVPDGLISKIMNMKQSGMKFGDIIKNLSGDEAKMAMDAIAPPSLVQHEVQRITPSLGGLR